MTISYREIAGTFADGEPYQLQMPIYQFVDLRHGRSATTCSIRRGSRQRSYGLGLLEAVEEATIAAAADPDDADGDGISGKMNRVWNAVTGQATLGPLRLESQCAESLPTGRRGGGW